MVHATANLGGVADLFMILMKTNSGSVNCDLVHLPVVFVIHSWYCSVNCDLLDILVQQLQYGSIKLLPIGSIKMPTF